MGTGVGEAMLIGAAVGGGSSALMGGDPIKGAMLGAAGGGLGAGLGAAAGASGSLGSAGAASSFGTGLSSAGTGAVGGGTLGGTTGGAAFGTFGGAGTGAVGGTAGGSLGGTAGGSLGAGSTAFAPMTGVGISSTLPAASSGFVPAGAISGGSGISALGSSIGAGSSMVSPSTMSIANAMGPGNITGFAPALSNTKLGLIAGGSALSGMMDAERNKFGVPGKEDYVSSFDPTKFERSTPTYAPEGVYRPEYKTYAAEGGIMRLAVGGSVDDELGGDYSAMGMDQGNMQKGLFGLGYAEGGISEILEDAKAQGLTLEAYQNIYGRGNAIDKMQKALKEGMMVNPGMARGGISSLGGYSDGGRMLKGPGDGMSDSIPASIANKQPARLADGEFVVPADVVSHLGNGSTDAGAKQLYAMMDKVRKARTGKKKQAPAVKANQYMPA